eukprot:scaffold17203_cov55-Phaeocystis_antarctica.AAC.1
MKGGCRRLAHIAGHRAVLADHVPHCRLEGLASCGAVGAERVQLQLCVAVVGDPVGVIRRHASDDAVGQSEDVPLGAREATQAEGGVIYLWCDGEEVVLRLGAIGDAIPVKVRGKDAARAAIGVLISRDVKDFTRDALVKVPVSAIVEVVSVGHRELAVGLADSTDGRCQGKRRQFAVGKRRPVVGCVGGALSRGERHEADPTASRGAMRADLVQLFRCVPETNACGHVYGVVRQMAVVGGSGPYGASSPVVIREGGVVVGGDGGGVPTGRKSAEEGVA